MEIYQSCARQILRNFFSLVSSYSLITIIIYFKGNINWNSPCLLPLPLFPPSFLFFLYTWKSKNDGAVYVSVKYVSRATFNEPNLDIRASFSNEILSRERESVLHIRDQNVNTRKIFLVPIVLRFVEQGEIRSVVTIRTTRFPEDFPTFSSE